MENSMDLEVIDLFCSSNNKRHFIARIKEDTILAKFLKIIYDFYFIGNRKLDEVNEASFCRNLIDSLHSISIDYQLKEYAKSTSNARVNIQG
ncbi:uncharacterized protein B0P05DRAFT_558421 [Gilbertella persicaria]|uniref:uncharacterized protein n=1 Tax=Gilbertella persicaria TaxID=101096 RepID=UPI00221F8D74|nr:uncharacterized protein B0P05DRAFT_558421 [Gilbertella persicaria]KAI8059386.1 hypothetical protein B0P05DRAFT_558421 [Gilbertella persicaria]